jgi:hypothetical protein
VQFEDWLCTAVCGDGECEDGRGEDCGVSGLQGCAADCGLCTGGTICFVDGDCVSGDCFLGFCTGNDRPAGKVCTEDAQCHSGNCVAGLCIQHCGDEACDGTETCGSSRPFSCGADCGGCQAGQFCVADDDCGSGVCGLFMGIVPFLCTERKTAGKPCSHDNECFSGNCFPGPGFCVQRCGDTVCDGTERCGGSRTLACTSDCDKCLLGDACRFNDDCASGICNFLKCTDARKDLGGTCSTDAACRSDNCVLGLCAQRCGDGLCEGTEGCGATNPLACTADCGRCTTGTPCIANPDCASGICNFFQCLGAPRGAGSLCSTDAACVSGNCVAGVCAPRCGDRACDGLEVCGVSRLRSCTTDCGLCPNGSLCVSGADCRTGRCLGVCF